MKNIKEFDQFLNEAAPAGAVTDPIDQLKKDFAGKAFTTAKYDGGSGISWGKGKSVGLFVSYDMGKPTIEITFTKADNVPTPEFIKLTDAAKKLGGELDPSYKIQKGLFRMLAPKEKLAEIKQLTDMYLATVK